MNANDAPKTDSGKRDQPVEKGQAATSPKQQNVKGQVLGPEGKPIAGATVYAAWTLGGLAASGGPYGRLEDKIVAETKTDAQGHFVLTVSLDNPDPKRETLGWKIVAFADGFGPSWQRDVFVTKNASAGSAVTLGLVEDKPIRGRIVDLEGNPRAGIHARIHALHAAPSEQAIADWIQDTKKKRPPRSLEDYVYPGLSMASRTSPFPGPFPSRWNDGFLGHGSLALPADGVTDRDGRIQFKGLGADRLLILELSGQAIAKCRVQVVGRAMEAVLAEPLEKTGVRAGTYYGREFQFVAEGTQPIAGTVTDAATGKPLVGVEVNVERTAPGLFQQGDFLATRTDKQGRYRIDGTPPGGGHQVKVNFALDQPYFPTEKEIKAASGFGPITCDFALHRGRWITGKLTDRDSKSPVKGAMIEYLPLRDNQHAKDYSNYDPNITGHVPSGRYTSSADGSFRVLAIPGKGVLGAIALNQDEYIYMTLNKDTVPKNLIQANDYLTTYHPWTITGYHAIKEVEVPESNEPTKVDLEFTRGLSRTLKIVDEQGQPVTGVRVLGRVFPPNLEQPASESTVEVIGLRPKDERDVVLLHPEQKIGKAIVISAGGQMTVRLEPCAIVRGRIVNDEAQPFSGLNVNVSIERPDAWNRELLGAVTRDDGRFEVLIPPGTTYRIWHYAVKPDEFSVSAECRSPAGAVIELGDLKNGAKLSVDQTDKMIVKADEKSETKAATPKPDKPTGPESTNANRSVIHGRITGVDGKPAAGADVAVIARRNSIGRGGDLDSRADVLAETKSDSDGRYEIELTGVSSRTHQSANLIARSSGTALAWRRLNLDAGEVEASFELQPEQPISGKLVDIEGQPAPGVRFQVASVMAGASASNLQEPAEGVGYSEWYSHDPHLPNAWPQLVETDRDGRFTIHGIPKEHGVWLQVEGDDRFAPQSLVLNSGMSEQRGERDATYRPQVVKNLKPGEEAVLPLAPAQLFTGTVRYEDSKEPAPHARLVIGASQQKFGSWISIAGKADEKGYYKTSPSPGIQFDVLAYPPDNAPYLVRQIKSIPWDAGAKSKTVDIKLPRGVLVRGKVLEEGSNSPIAGASVQYAPEGANNPNALDSIITGWQDSHLTDNRGRFQIVVLPGPGRLLVDGPTNGFVFQEVTERELHNGKPGWRRNYVHGIERVNPAPKETSLDIVVRLKRGATVRGELVDERGTSVEDARIFSRLEFHPLSIFWRGFGDEAKDGRFEISGLAPDQEYRVCFLDGKRRLGATVNVRAGMASPKVVLEPCGAAKMRFVDDKGKPVANFEPTVQFVMTPGELQYSEAAMKSNAITADAAFISNIDQANHSRPEKSDERGELTVAALIPGATYQVCTFSKRRSALSKEFQAIDKQTIDLGDIVVERRE